MQAPPSVTTRLTQPASTSPGMCLLQLLLLVPALGIYLSLRAWQGLGIAIVNQLKTDTLSQWRSPLH